MAEAATVDLQIGFVDNMWTGVSLMANLLLETEPTVEDYKVPF